MCVHVTFLKMHKLASKGILICLVDFTKITDRWKSGFMNNPCLRQYMAGEAR